jgi:Holliday junction resolvase
LSKPKFSRGEHLRYWRRKGFDSERKLVQLFKDKGFMGVRIPVSASSSEPLPDVVVSRLSPPCIYAIETKAVTKVSWTVEAHQIKKCLAFLGMLPVGPSVEKKALVIIHFLAGERVKGMWVVKEVSEAKDTVVNVTDKSYIALTKPSKRWRERIIQNEPA